MAALTVANRPVLQTTSVHVVMEEEVQEDVLKL